MASMEAHLGVRINEPEIDQLTVIARRQIVEAKAVEGGGVQAHLQIERRPGYCVF